MSFDWMEPKRNPAHEKTLEAKRQAMYRVELEERAALLHRLGHPRARVKARLEAQMGWDFGEGARRPTGGAAKAHGGEGGHGKGFLDGILDREYGAAATGAPRTNGGAK